MSKKMITSRGKNFAGATIGIIASDTTLPRAIGDVGHAATYPFPVLYRVARGASPHRLVHESGSDRPDNEGTSLCDRMIAAGLELVKEGAEGITTSGGFCSIFQDALTAALKVPVASSCLMQIPVVQRLLPREKRVGVVTVHGGSLGPEHLVAAGADPATPIVGTENGTTITRALLAPERSFDFARAEEDLLTASRKLLTDYKDIGALVLECHSFSAYSAMLNRELQMPVFDFYSFVCWFHAGLAPRRFHQAGWA